MFLIRICVKLGIIVGLGLLGRIMPLELGTAWQDNATVTWTAWQDNATGTWIA